MSEAMREAFEAWAVSRTGGQYSLDEYDDAVLGFGWDAWQAALSGAQQGEPVPNGRYKLIPYNVGISADTCFLIVDTETGEKLYRGASSFESVSREAGERIVSALNSQPLTAAPSGDPAQLPDELRAKALDLCAAVENENDLPPVKYALKCGRLINELRAMLTAAPSGDAKREADKPINVDWPICNPACDPSLNGGTRSRGCVCEAAKASIARQSSDGDDSEDEPHG